MIKGFAFLVIAAALFSCEQKTETVDFDDLAPSSERYDNDKPKKVEEVQKDDKPLASPFLTIADTLLPDARWKIWDTTLFADRFGPKFNEKYFLVSSRDSITLQHYEFKDSLRTKNAFFNYLDCFGPKCRSYQVGDNLKFPKRNGLILVGVKHIYILEGNSKVNELAVRQKLEKDRKKENWIYVIDVPKSGKTTWKRIDKGEERIITKTL
jgi:hypothetical protein